jgi:hypothetical protein
MCKFKKNYCKFGDSKISNRMVSLAKGTFRILWNARVEENAEDEMEKTAWKRARRGQNCIK